MKTAMQTVIDYLQEMIDDDFDSRTKYIQEFCEQILETEKQQIIDLCTEAYEMGLGHKYYNPADIFESNKETLK